VRKLFAALLIAAVATTGIATPAAAADTTGPTINWAGGVDDDLGRIQVSASSTAGMTSFVTHLIAPDTGEEWRTGSAVSTTR